MENIKTNDSSFFDFANGKLLINLTNLCNFDCKMCVGVQDEEISGLTRDEAMELADFAIENKFHTVEVSGGVK